MPPAAGGFAPKPPDPPKQPPHCEFLATRLAESDILNAKKKLFEKVIINGKIQRLIKRQGDNKNDMNVKDILEFLHLPDAYMKYDPSSKPIYATATCNFPPVDDKNIDGLTIVHDLNLVNEEIKSLKQKSSAVHVQQLSDQLAEIKCMVSELSALTRKKRFQKIITFIPAFPGSQTNNYKQTYLSRETTL